MGRVWGSSKVPLKINGNDAKLMVMMRRERAENCGYCERNLHTSKEEGGCSCCREHYSDGKSSYRSAFRTLDLIDDFYEGYGIYDSIRRNIEQEEFYE